MPFTTATIHPPIGERYKEILSFCYELGVGACAVALLAGNTTADWRIAILLVFTSAFFLIELVETNCEKDRFVSDWYFAFGALEAAFGIMAAICLGAQSTTWFDRNVPHWTPLWLDDFVKAHALTIYYVLMALNLFFLVVSRAFRREHKLMFVDRLCLAGLSLFAGLAACEEAFPGVFWIQYVLIAAVYGFFGWYLWYLRFTKWANLPADPT